MGIYMRGRGTEKQHTYIEEYNSEDDGLLKLIFLQIDIVITPTTLLHVGLSVLLFPIPYSIWEDWHI